MTILSIGKIEWGLAAPGGGQRGLSFARTPRGAGCPLLLQPGRDQAAACSILLTWKIGNRRRLPSGGQPKIDRMAGTWWKRCRAMAATRKSASVKPANFKAFGGEKNHALMCLSVTSAKKCMAQLAQWHGNDSPEGWRRSMAKTRPFLTELEQRKRNIHKRRPRRSGSRCCAAGSCSGSR